MKINVQNDLLRATFSSRGAELQSLYNLPTQTERLWNGDPAFWPKYSPILFPTVGGLKEDTYFFAGKEYHLLRHGFAREREFDILHQDETSVTFVLTQDEETLKLFPFAFRLEIKYELLETRLRCTYAVSNPDDQPMYFSIGAHPAFALPLSPDEKFEDYYLEFNRDEELYRYPLVNNLIGLTPDTITLSQRRLPLRYDYFTNDAIVLKDLKSNEIKLISTKHDHSLAFHFEDFPYFGIWTIPGAGFLCLEPWCGIGDNFEHNQQLTQKEGIIRLEKNQDWSRFWEVGVEG